MTSRRSPTLRFLLAVLAVALASGCSQGLFASKKSDVVTGTIAYRERIALPAGATVEVKLSDATHVDVAASIVAESKFSADGHQVPISFELRYDARDVLDTHIYVVRAAIRFRGRMLFATDTAYPVITQGKPKAVDLVLVRVAEEGP